jgi:uncharacterized hydrophobic protein (TIGR00271 family)
MSESVSKTKQEQPEKIDAIHSRLTFFPSESFFKKLEFFDISGEQKGDIAQEIVKEDANGDALYWMMIVLSSGIATFGLLQNSVAIIIGAMLIAPLLQPMKAMAFAISTGRSTFFWKAFWFLSKSVFISVGVAALLLFLVPIKIETSEILARTTPNILDLFVAIFSAMLAFLSIAYKKLSDSLAGVAMAASLMPPLAVCGIEIALGNYLLAWGGFFLFFVNFLAILIVGVVIFIMFGFTPHEELKKKMSSRKIMTLLMIILFTVFPLYSSLTSISEKVHIQKDAEQFLKQEVPAHIKGGELSDLVVNSHSKELVSFKGTLRIPDNVDVYKETYLLMQDNFLEEMKKKYPEKKIAVEFDKLRIVSFATKEEVKVDFEEVLKTSIRKYFAEEFPMFTLVQMDAQKISEKNEEKMASSIIETASAAEKIFWTTRLTVSVPSGEYLEEEQKKQFIEKVSEEFSDKNLRFVWVTIAEAPHKVEEKKATPQEQFQNILQLEWEHFFAQEFFTDIEVRDFSVSWKLNETPAEKNTEESKNENNEGSEEKALNTKKTAFSQENIERITVSGYIYFPAEKEKEAILQEIDLFIDKLPYEKVVRDFRLVPYTRETREITKPSEEDPENISEPTSDNDTSE